jgi:hypothetical protein
MPLKIPTQRIKFFVVTIMLMIHFSAKAGSNTDFQTWIPININVKLTGQWRGFLEFQPYRR